MRRKLGRCGLKHPSLMSLQEAPQQPRKESEEEETSYTDMKHKNETTTSLASRDHPPERDETVDTHT